MNIQTLRRPAALLLGCLTMWSGLASAEPPSRAARLGYISGTVSFSPAAQPDWVQAVVNRPLTTGDRLWADGEFARRAAGRRRRDPARRRPAA